MRFKAQFNKNDFNIVYLNSLLCHTENVKNNGSSELNILAELFLNNKFHDLD